MSDRVDRIGQEIVQRPYKPAAELNGPTSDFDRAVVEILRNFNDRLNELGGRTDSVENRTRVIG